MKTRTISIILSLSFITSLSLTIWLYYQLNNEVGDISYDASFDCSEFVLCQKKAFQYYSVGTNYNGGRKAIREDIFKNISIVDLGQKSGYITFRFIINCRGNSGRFRVKQVDNNFNKTEFNEIGLNKIQDAVEKLDKWLPGMLNNESVDSYYQINFKIHNGKIVDIF